MDERVITSTIVDSSTSTTICHIANIYAPASPTDRPAFYQQLQNHPLLQDPTKDWILLGDFNIHMHCRIRQ
ncbi:hypothetical protein BC941DRAFT_446612 [Chlamydoabsidia padenii]|nr:hypothetical protein BC941DRAFT_446612 [Chlamydoabsidia padenii]